MKNQKVLVLTLLFLLGTVASMKAQVAIGTNNPNMEPHPGAILDLSQVAGKNLGLLLPQVVLNSSTDVTSIAGNAPADGLMVYNPGTAGLAAGVYVWYGNRWWAAQAPSINTADQLLLRPARYELSTAVDYSTNPSAEFVIFNLTNSPITVPASVTGSFTVPASVGPIAALNIALVTVTANPGLAANNTPYEGILTVGTGSNARTAVISLAVNKQTPTLTFDNFAKLNTETNAFVPTVITNSTGAKTFTVLSGSNIVSAVTGNTQLQISGTTGDATIRVNVAESADYLAASTTAMLTVVGKPVQPGTITALATNPCKGATGVTYSVAEVFGATSYTWEVPTGWTITEGNGTRSITVAVSSSAVAGDISVTATNSYGNSPAKTIAVTVNDIPATPGAITASATTVAAGATGVTYSVLAVTYATSYTWTLPSGWSITAGSGTRSITATASTDAVSGNISVKANSVCGSSSENSIAVTVTCEGAIIKNGAYNDVSANSSLGGDFSAGWKGTFTNPIGDLCWNKSDTGGQQNWNAAKNSCTGKWRLPNLKELQVLYEALGGTGDGTDGTHFANLTPPNTNLGKATDLVKYCYWSSTVYLTYPYVFYTRTDDTSGRRIGVILSTALANVRCVRTLQ